MFDSARELGHLLHRISRLSKQLISKNLAETGLTGPQARVLLYLWRCPDGPVHQRDIEETFSLSAPTVNGILQRLLEKGLITRETSERDARYNLHRAHGRGPLASRRHPARARAPGACSDGGD